MWIRIWALVPVLVGAACSSRGDRPDRELAHWQSAAFGVPESIEMPAEAADAAARSGVLSTVPSDLTEFPAVIATARAPLYESPSTTSRLLGTIVEGGVVKVTERLLWYRVPEDWCSETWGEKDGMLPTWARVDARVVAGFVPWRCLAAPGSIPDPVAVRQSVLQLSGSDLASGGSSRKNFSEKKSRQEPDFDSIDRQLRSDGMSGWGSGAEAGPIEIDFRSPSPAEAFYLGRLLAARLAITATVLEPEDARSIRVREIGDGLVQQCTMPRPYADWTWIVVDQPVRASIALPGGFVIVTLGLLESLEEDEHLAALLAREVALVEQGHPSAAIAEAVAIDEAEQKAAETWGLLRSFAAAAGAAGVDGAFEMQQAMQIAERIEAELGIRAAIFEGILKSYERARDRSADARAIQLLSSAGWRPESLGETLKRLQSADGSALGGEDWAARLARIDGLVEVHRRRFETDRRVDSAAEAEPASP